MLHALIIIGFDHQIKKRCYIRAVTKVGKERREVRKHFAVLQIKYETINILLFQPYTYQFSVSISNDLHQSEKKVENLANCDILIPLF